jgi:glycosyltransferase involved in cell wall biosynthesis
MSKHPLVSCIIIFFNAGENFFVEAIASVFAQTYDNWELLLVDDGSTDESTAIAQQYSEKYPEKVSYLEHEGHENHGMSATRNLGIRHAKGEYIAFLDADDVWLSHKLEQQVALLEAYPEAAMLYGKTQFWFSWAPNNPFWSLFSSNDEQTDLMTATSVEFNKLIQPPAQLLLYLKDRNIYPCSCSIIIRRQIFEIVGGFEDEFRSANEDMVFHSKVFLRFPVYVSSHCWDRYRIHPDSYWRTAWRQGIGKETEQAGRFNYLIWLEKYLIEQGVKDLKVWIELKKALMPFRNPALYRLVKSSQYPIKLARRIAGKIKRKFVLVLSH